MIIGLTGGIGTGKSTAAHIFKDLGATVVSADELGHKAMHSTGGAYQDIIDRFSNENGYQGIPKGILLNPDGEINRRVLGYHVFLNPGELEDLERIVHPVVERLFLDFVTEHENDSTIIIYECAILFENGIDMRLYPPMSYTISTWCPIETQIARVMERDQVDRDNVLRRMKRQLDAEEKRDQADFVIDTSVGQDVEGRVKTLYDIFKRILPIRQQLRALVDEAIGNFPDRQKEKVERPVPSLAELD